MEVDVSVGRGRGHQRHVVERGEEDAPVRQREVQQLPEDYAAFFALSALALPAGAGREAALDHVIAHQAIKLDAVSEIVPMDPTFRGWSWTPFTFGWIEPTSRALLALQVLRPAATAEIEDAVKFAEDSPPADRYMDFTIKE